MKYTLIGSLLLVGLLTVGCPVEDDTVSDAGSDLGHDLLMGEHCTDDSQCVSGLCIGEAPNKYCTATGCTLHSDCVNHAEGEDYDMCCIEVTDLGMVCLKYTTGYQCEDPPTPIGTPCGDDPEICVGTTCAGEGEEAICTYACTTSADCYNWITEGYRCEDVGAERYCMLYNTVLCDKSADCPEGETCSVAINADLTELFGECATHGALPPGSECNDEDDPNLLTYEQRCSGLYCFGGRCSAVCQDDEDCPEGMACVEISFENVDDTISACQGI